jgi:hypothetical protein
LLEERAEPGGGFGDFGRRRLDGGLPVEVGLRLGEELRACALKSNLVAQVVDGHLAVLLMDGRAPAEQR